MRSIALSEYRLDLPAYGHVKAVDKQKEVAVVAIRGVKILNVEVYSGKEVSYPSLETIDGWQTFELRKGECFNFIFLDHWDGRGHFAQVSMEDNQAPRPWLGDGISVVMNDSMQPCMTAKQFVSQ